MTESTQIAVEDLPQLYDEARSIAKRLLAGWSGVDTIGPTHLVHTALRRQLHAGQPWEELRWESPAHFRGQVFRAMKQALCDYKDRKAALKRGPANARSSIELDDIPPCQELLRDPDLLLDIERALERLEARDPMLANLVRYRFFWGDTWEEIAILVDCSLAEVKRRWKRAQLLLQAALREQARDCGT